MPWVDSTTFGLRPPVDATNAAECSARCIWIEQIRIFLCSCFVVQLIANRGDASESEESGKPRALFIQSHLKHLISNACLRDRLHSVFVVPLFDLPSISRSFSFSHHSPHITPRPLTPPDTNWLHLVDSISLIWNSILCRADRSLRTGCTCWAPSASSSTRPWTPSTASRPGALAAAAPWASSSTTAAIASGPCSS